MASEFAYETLNRLKTLLPCAAAAVAAHSVYNSAEAYPPRGAASSATNPLFRGRPYLDSARVPYAFAAMPPSAPPVGEGVKVCAASLAKEKAASMASPPPPLFRVIPHLDSARLPYPLATMPPPAPPVGGGVRAYATSPERKGPANSPLEAAFFAGIARSSLLPIGLHAIDNMRTRSQVGGRGSIEIIQEAMRLGPWRGAADIMWTGMAPNLARTLSREVARGAAISLVDDKLDHPVAKAIFMTALDVAFMPLEKMKVQANSSKEAVLGPIVEAIRSGNINSALEGCKRAYAGSSAMALRQGSRWAIFFAVDDKIKEALKEDGELSGNRKLYAAAISAFCTGAIPVPFDVIKSKMQASPEKTTFLETCQTILKREGLRGFGRGGIYKFLLTATPAFINSLVRSLPLDEIKERMGINGDGELELPSSVDDFVIGEDLCGSPITLGEMDELLVALERTREAREVDRGGAGGGRGL